MFLKAIRGFISVSRRRELSTLLEFFNLVQHENQWRNSQFYYLRQNPIEYDPRRFRTGSKTGISVTTYIRTPTLRNRVHKVGLERSGPERSRKIYCGGDIFTGSLLRCYKPCVQIVLTTYTVSFQNKLDK